MGRGGTVVVLVPVGGGAGALVGGFGAVEGGAAPAAGSPTSASAPTMPAATSLDARDNPMCSATTPHPSGTSADP